MIFIRENIHTITEGLTEVGFFWFFFFANLHTFQHPFNFISCFPLYSLLSTKISCSDSQWSFVFVISEISLLIEWFVLQPSCLLHTGLLIPFPSMMANRGCQLHGTWNHNVNKSLSMSVKDCIEKVNWGGKAQPKCGCHHSMLRDPTQKKGTKINRA